jgi:hypothetical protein
MFRDSSDVIADVTGDPDTAGFVQVMQGRSSDPDRARELMAQDPDEWAAFRPDIIAVWRWDTRAGLHRGHVLHLRTGSTRRRTQRAPS